jgi:GNAT superfamily N-acetyltransferase
MDSLLLAWKKHRSSLPKVMLKKLLGKLVRVETLVVYRHELMSLPLLHADRSTVQFVRLDDVASEAFHNLCRQYPHKKFHERLRRPGQLCYIALRANQIAGYAWVTRTDIYVEEISCMYPVAPGEIFIYDCFVDPLFRGAGIYPAMLGFIIEDGQQQNTKLKNVGIAASALNQASIRGILKAGFIEQKRIRYVECLQKQRWWGLHPAEA